VTTAFPVTVDGTTFELGPLLRITTPTPLTGIPTLLQGFAPLGLAMVSLPVNAITLGTNPNNHGNKLLCLIGCAGCNDRVPGPGGDDPEDICGSVPPPPQLTGSRTIILPQSGWTAGGPIRLFATMAELMTDLEATEATYPLHYVFEIASGSQLTRFDSTVGGTWNQGPQLPIPHAFLTIAIAPAVSP
jgi:hypothetical protein